MNKEDEIIHVEMNEKDVQDLVNCYEKDIKYIEQLEQELDKYKNIVDKVKSVLNEYKAKAYSDYDVDDVLSDLDYIFTIEAVNERLTELKGE